MERNEGWENRADTKKVSSGKMIAVALIPIAVLAGMIVFLFGPAQSLFKKAT